MNNLEINNITFESIKHIDEYGNEYWEARELQEAYNIPNGENSKV